MSTTTRRRLAAMGIATFAVAGSGVATADAGGRPLSAELRGAAEVPGPGDLDGTGTASVTVNPGLGEVCFELAVSGIAPATAAHIHVGAVGVPGPVVVSLEPPTDGTSAGCVDGVDRGLAVDLIRHPEEYYVNVHNADFADGAVRGQLGKS